MYSFSFPLRGIKLFYWEAVDLLKMTNDQNDNWNLSQKYMCFRPVLWNQEVWIIMNVSPWARVRSLFCAALVRQTGLVHQTENGLTWDASTIPGGDDCFCFVLFFLAPAVCFNARQKRLWRHSPPDPSGASGPLHLFSLTGMHFFLLPILQSLLKCHFLDDVFSNHLIQNSITLPLYNLA